MTNTYSAEYGLTMGSQMRIVTKSGTNQFHGEAFDYLRNSVLNSRNYFDLLYTLPRDDPGGGRRVAPFRRNQFGGTLGGPIKKDKTFFFGDYEGFREVLDNPPDVGVTPTIPAACHTPVVGGVQTVDNTCDSKLAPGNDRERRAGDAAALGAVAKSESSQQPVYVPEHRNNQRGLWAGAHRPEYIGRGHPVWCLYHRQCE